MVGEGTYKEVSSRVLPPILVNSVTAQTGAPSPPLAVLMPVELSAFYNIRDVDTGSPDMIEIDVTVA